MASWLMMATPFPSNEIPSGIPQEVADRLHEFTGRGWVFEQIAAWLGSETSVFLMTGGPGSGKSAIGARLVQLSRGEAATGAHPPVAVGAVAYAHFCRARDDPTLDPIRFVEALSNELSYRYPSYHDALRSLHPAISEERITATGQAQAESVTGGRVAAVLLEVSVQEQSARVAFDRLVRRPLELMASQDRLNEKIVILIDGLDEAVTYPGEENIATVIGTACQEEGGLPKHVSFLLSTRHDDRVLRWFDQKPFDLEAEAPDDVNDVGEYVSNRLEFLPEGRRRHLAASIAEAGKGNFLYARYVVDELIADPEQLNESAILSLPNGLDGHYREYLRRELARSDEPWEQRYRPLLGLLAVARGAGLTPTVLAKSSGLKPSQANDALRRLRQYVSAAPAGPIRLFHQSFRDYLLSNSDHPIYADEAEGDLARHLIGSVPKTRSGAPIWGRADDYTKAYLAYHAAVGGQLDQLMIDPWFLLEASPLSLTPVLHRALSRQARQAAQAYGIVAYQLQSRRGDNEKAALLRLASMQVGASHLSEEVRADRGGRSTSQDSESLGWWPCWVWWQQEIPTTVIGQIDAGLRGLVAVELSGGKPVSIVLGVDGLGVWDIETRQRLSYRAHRSWELASTRALAPLTLDGRDFLAAAYVVELDGTLGSALRLFEMPSLRLVEESQPVSGTISSISSIVGLDPPLLASNEGGDIALWSLPGLKFVTKQSHAHRWSVYGVQEYRLGNSPVLVTAGDTVEAGHHHDEDPVHVWTLPDLNPIKSFGREVTLISGFHLLDLSNGPALLGWSFDDLLCWSLLDSKLLFRFQESSAIHQVIRIGARDFLLNSHGIFLRSLSVVERKSSEKLEVEPLLGEFIEMPSGPMFGGVVHVHGQRCLVGGSHSQQTWAVQDLLDAIDRNRQADIRTVSTSERRITALATTPDEILAGTEDGVIQRWRLQDGERLDPWVVGHSVAGLAFAGIDAGSPVAVGLRSGMVRLLDSVSGLPALKEFPTGRRLMDLTVAHARNRAYLVTGSQNPWGDPEGAHYEPHHFEVRIWDIETEEELHVARRPLAPMHLSGWHDKPMTSVATFALSGRTVVAAAGYAPLVGLWDLETGDLIAYLDCPRVSGGVDDIVSLTAHSTTRGPIVVAGSRAGQIFMWLLEQMETLGWKPGESRFATEVFADGSRQTSALYDMIELKPHLSIPNAHSGVVSTVAVVEWDGSEVIVSGSLAGSIRAWSLDGHIRAEVATAAPVTRITPTGIGLTIGTYNGLINLATRDSGCT